jgi:hypothetical protein
MDEKEYLSKSDITHRKQIKGTALSIFKAKQGLEI